MAQYPEPPPSEENEDTAKTGSRRPLLLGVSFVAVAALAATIGAFGARSVAPAPAASGSEDTGSAIAASVVAEYGEERGTDDVHTDEPLVDTDWLEERLGDDDVVVIEVSEGREGSTLTSYEAGHIPGAVEFVWYRDFVDRLTRDIASPERFGETARAAGIDEGDTVVLYGDANNWFAAYGAWVFSLYGFDDVRLLDGGRVAWEAEGRELSASAPSPAEGSWEPEAPNASIRAFQPEVLAVATGEEEGVIVDIRGPAEFSGEIGVAEGFGGEAAAKWGHIPGAINAPWGQAVNQPDDGGDGTFLDEDALRQHFADLGIDGSEPIIVYCRIGERASHTWFALSQILGYDVTLYDGSWTEWGNSVGVPVSNPTLEASGDFSGLWGGN